MDPRRQRPRTNRGELDLTLIDGDPSQAADKAYARQKTDVHLEGSLPSGRFKAIVSAPDRSPVVTAVAYGSTVPPAAVVALVLYFIGLEPAWASAAAGTVWLIMVSGLIAAFWNNRDSS